MKVAIVGGGIAGLSLAWALKRRGAKVVLFEKGPLPNPRGSSFDEHRITRHTYGGLEGYGRLMPQAFAAYEALWRDLGRSHLHREKLVYIHRQPSDWLETTARDLAALGIGHRQLGLDEVRTRLPMLDQEGIVEAFEADGAGMLFADRIVRDLVRWLAEQDGVELRPGSTVTAIDADAARVVADGVAFDADAVVVAAGAWVGDLLPALAGRLVPSRQTVLYLAPPEEFAGAWAAAPIIVDQGPGHGTYILPPKDGTRLKVGDHLFTRRGHGDDDRVAREDDIAPVREAARKALAGFGRYGLAEAKVCYYTVTEDERFVIEPVGRAGWVMSACSGHGFKLAALMAQGLAEGMMGEAGRVAEWAAGR